MPVDPFVIVRLVSKDYNCEPDHIFFYNADIAQRQGYQACNGFAEGFQPDLACGFYGIVDHLIIQIAIRWCNL